MAVVVPVGQRRTVARLTRGTVGGSVVWGTLVAALTGKLPVGCAVREARTGCMGVQREGFFAMEDRVFGLKGVAAAGAGAAAVVGGLGSVAAQDDDADVNTGGMSGGDITVGDVAADAMVEVAGDDEETEESAEDDDAAEEDEDDVGGTTTSLDISSTPALAISDASGGDNNFAFVS